MSHTQNSRNSFPPTYRRASNNYNSQAGMPNIHSNQRSSSNSNLSKYNHELKAQLNALNKENFNILSGIELISTEIVSLTESHFELLDENLEKKTIMALLKKEMEVKRTYLCSIVKLNKTRIQESQLMKFSKLENCLDSIVSISSDINSLNLNLNMQGLNIEPLDNIDFHGFFTLLRSS